MLSTNPISSWAAEDRPREKLMSYGIHTLSNAELLAILIGSGNRTTSAVELCKIILKEYDNSINELGKASVKDLMVHNGIGEAKAISIVAALELGKRRKSEQVKHKRSIHSSADVYHWFQSKLSDISHEEFWILSLSRSNKIISEHNISRGGISGTIADPKLIFNKLISDKASGCILVHNHPSGNLQASRADKLLTQKIINGAKFFDIFILDHVIVADQSFFSFADEGLL